MPRFSAADNSPHRLPVPSRRLIARGAFTLVEVMLVIVLLGLMAAAVIGNFTPNVHERIDATASVVLSDVAYVRSLAVANNSKYRLTFDATNNCYTLDHSGPETALHTLPSSVYWTAGSTANTQVMDLGKLPLGAPLVQIVAVTKNSAAPSLVTDLEFGPLGGTTRTEDTTIWLGCCQGSERRYMSVRVDPTTGLGVVGAFTNVVPAVVVSVDGGQGVATGGVLTPGGSP